MTELTALKANLAQARAAVRKAAELRRYDEAARLYAEAEKLDDAILGKTGYAGTPVRFNWEHNRIIVDGYSVSGIRGILADAGYAIVPLEDAAYVQARQEVIRRANEKLAPYFGTPGGGQ